MYTCVDVEHTVCRRIISVNNQNRSLFPQRIGLTNLWTKIHASTQAETLSACGFCVFCTDRCVWLYLVRVYCTRHVRVAKGVSVHPGCVYAWYIWLYVCLLCVEAAGCLRWLLGRAHASLSCKPYTLSCLMDVFLFHDVSAYRYDLLSMVTRIRSHADGITLKYVALETRGFRRTLPCSKILMTSTFINTYANKRVQVSMYWYQWKTVCAHSHIHAHEVHMKKNLQQSGIWAKSWACRGHQAPSWVCVWRCSRYYQCVRVAQCKINWTHFVWVRSFGVCRTISGAHHN